MGRTDSLYRRIRKKHIEGDASQSTLRKSVGCLLQAVLGIRLRSTGTRNTETTFGKDGEAKLTKWLHDHARVVWMKHQEPEKAEKELIDRLSLPLNLEGNERHPFYGRLSWIRAKAEEELEQ